MRINFGTSGPLTRFGSRVRRPWVNCSIVVPDNFTEAEIKEAVFAACPAGYIVQGWRPVLPEDERAPS